MKIKKILSLILAATLLMSLVSGCGNHNSGTNNDPAAAVSVTDETSADPAGEDSGSGYEEGVSANDDIVKTSSADKVLLVVSFGTSFNESRKLTIGGLEQALQNAYPDYQVRRAFTSQIIIDKLAERDKLIIDNVAEAMDRLILDKVKEVVIQPSHVMSGYEYDDVIAQVMPYSDKFESFQIGKPLLIDDADYEDVAEIIMNETTSFRAEDTAIVFMGHGTEHSANATYTKLQGILEQKGYNDYLIGTVEAEPTLEEVQEKLAEKNIKKVVLRPLMVVAGDHANNDMAGDEEDSWKVILTEDGYEVTTVIEGLGQIKGIQDIYIRHVKEAMESDNLSATAISTTRAAALAVGIGPSGIKNGTYPIEVTSNTSMFKIVDCQLTVADDDMTAVITLSGQGFGKVYPGTGEAALQDTEENFYHYTDNGEQHFFTLPVRALDCELDLAGFSIRKEEWYDHLVVFKSENIPADAFLPGKAEVTLSGGSGRAGIESPVRFEIKNGTSFAEIIWSSPNYIYMIVDGKEYLPINAEGNSVFEIPVVFDTNMDVIACTTAMSEPKEITYTLNFNSSSINYENYE